MRTSKNCSGGASAGLVLVLGLGPLAGGCDYFAEPSRRKMDDSRAVAMVEAAQRQMPPRRALQPQLLPDDIRQAAGQLGAGCNFSPSVNDRGPIFTAGPSRGLVKIGGALVVLSADSGSVEVTPGLRQQYDGKQISLEIARDANDTTNVAQGQRWPAKLTIRDKYERPVYFGVGVMACDS